MTDAERETLIQRYTAARRAHLAEVVRDWRAVFSELARPEPDPERLADLEWELLGDCEIVGQLFPD